jgi:carbamoyltransferase
MIQLGLSGFYHDSAATIVIDGKVICAIEEEKLSGIKHDSSFPFKAIQWCLEYTKITIDEVDMVCWYEDPNLKYERVKETIGKWGGLRFPMKWRQFNKRWNENEGNLKKILKSIGYDGIITYTKHHLSHLALSYYTSPFDSAIGLSIDGVGERETIYAAMCDNKGFHKIQTLHFPHSLGLIYSAFTAYLGFKPNEGEYKVMGLAPYGDKQRYHSVFDKVAIIGGEIDIVKMDMSYFTWHTSDNDMFNNKLIDLIGFPPRFKDEPIEQCHKDLAASLQRWYEGALYFVINRITNIWECENLVLGGGCAYNGTANGKIKTYTSIKNVWIPFAPSDAGSAIGACLYHYHQTLGHPKVKGGDNQNPYLGEEWSNAELLKIILQKRVGGNNIMMYDTMDFLCKDVAKLINDGNIVGWFQGRTEFGARALGNRSILGNPHLSDIRDRINKVVKKREMFRPFAPSVTIEDYKKYFISQEDVPYMNQVVKVRSGVNIPSVTHVDNSARIQTLKREDNPLYYDLLKEFEKLTGTPILLNTSFNLKDHTMTNDPEKAIWTFHNCDMDYLVLGKFLISK